MALFAGNEVSAAGFDLTDPRDQAAFAAQLAAHDRRQKSWQQFKVGLVWLAMFMLLGIALRLLNVSYLYIFEHFGFVLEGIWVTLGVSLASITIATILALLGALGRLSPHAIFQGVSGFYVSIFRGTPLLVQIFIIYLGLPQIGQQLKAMGYPQLGNLFILGAIQSGILALSLNYGAYMTEIFRAGIQSVAKGQWQAASALGMSHLQTLRMVVMPQAIRMIIPAIGNQFIAMQKDSSLVSVMGIWEITYRANRFARKDSMFMEMFLLAAAMYWILTMISEWLQARLEQRMAQGEHR
ncbi:MAG: amino acid ABC transporter permease [Anaerolineales bacterium]|nr:amino acid ABC transporter permease [Anaerolineales bacterium]